MAAATTDRAAVRSEFAAADLALSISMSSEIDADVLVEETRALAAESANSAAISNEQGRAMTAEALNASNLVIEEVRSLNADAIHTADIAANLVKIGNEEVRAGLAETALGSRMDSALAGDGTEVFTKLLFSDGSVLYKMTVNATGELMFETN